MFNFFGQPNPARVAQSQLNKARLELLEVQTQRENLTAHESALMERIARLEKLATATDKVKSASSVNIGGLAADGLQ